AVISVVVPTLDEAPSLAQTLIAARRPGVGDIVVADGGSRDGTRAGAAPLADTVIVTARGRAVQMNAGAAAARGDVLLFVHADTRLPDDFADEIARALAAADDVAGFVPGVIG